MLKNNPLPRRRSTARAGLPLALISAAAFATSGVFGKALFQSGWSPTAAVTARIAIAALALAIPVVLQMRGNWHLLRRNLRAVVIYGMTGVAGCQLFYFLAVQRLSVGVALLLEYLSPVLLVLLAWVTTRRAPSPVTIIGATSAIAGLFVVLDVVGGLRLDAVGVAFGLAAAVCSAAYFLVASGDHDDALPPVALAGLGMFAGLIALLVVGATGILPMSANTAAVTVAGREVGVAVPLLGMGVLAAAFAYATGSVAARLLGSRVASFVALSEVLFAIVFAWLALGELPRPVQLAGGALVVLGVILVRWADREEREERGDAVSPSAEAAPVVVPTA